MAEVTSKNLRLSSTPYEREAREYAERVYRTLVALEPLYESFDAVSWLCCMQESLGGDRPMALLQTTSGTVRVQETIQRILDGAYS